MVSNTKPAIPKLKKKRKMKTHPKKKAIVKAVSEGSIPKKIETAPMSEGVMEQICERYPILKNKELIQSFLAVPMNNNQRGRIRQLLKDNLQGTSAKLLPDIINSKIQSILKSSDTLQEAELRKIRILFNMLKTATADEFNQKHIEEEKKIEDQKKRTEDAAKKEKNKPASPSKEVDSEKKSKVEKIKKHKDETKSDVKKDDKKLTTAKGVKRYVVFIGNLPLGIEKEQLKEHFRDFADRIKDIRIPEVKEGKKSSIAYVEMKDELGYELALSKHHSMLGSKRINVLYSMQKHSHITKEEAKSKSAKLIALQKSGQLLGSVPLNRKRSARRKKMKLARAREANE